MPDFPHESLESVRLSLEELCTEASRLQTRLFPNNAMRLREFHTANLMLAGRLLGEDGVTRRVFVDKPELHPDGNPYHADTAARCFGDMMAVMKQINLDRAISVYPLSMGHRKMENSLGLTHLCHTGVRLRLAYHPHNILRALFMIGTSSGESQPCENPTHSARPVTR